MGWPSGPGSAVTFPFVTGPVEADPAQYREIVVDPTARSGKFRYLNDACDYARARSTTTNQWAVRLLPGTYNADGLPIPTLGAGGMMLTGAGPGISIIQRTVNQTNSTGVGTSYLCDPVVSLVGAASPVLSGLTIRHAGSNSGIVQGTGGQFPVGVSIQLATAPRLINCVIEGTACGLYDAGNSTFTTGILYDDPNQNVVVQSCQLIGHFKGGVFRTFRREWFVYGSRFLCLVPAGTVMSIGGTDFVPSAFEGWEWTNAHLYGSDFILQPQITVAPLLNAESQFCAGLGIVDSASGAIMTANGCRFIVDLSGGDVNSSSLAVAAFYIAGGQPGPTNPGNTGRLAGCGYYYKTGTVTAARAIAGAYVQDINSTTHANWNNALIFDGGEATDLGGSGGTARADLVVGVRSLLGTATAAPKECRVNGARFKSFAYSQLSGGGSPQPEHDRFGTQHDTINYQRGTIALSNGTAAVTLPIAYPSLFSFADYTVYVEPIANETFWITAKTNTGFTINSSNGASVSTVRWTAQR